MGPRQRHHLHFPRAEDAKVVEDQSRGGYAVESMLSGTGVLASRRRNTYGGRHYARAKLQETRPKHAAEARYLPRWRIRFLRRRRRDGKPLRFRETAHCRAPD